MDLIFIDSIWTIVVMVVFVGIVVWAWSGKRAKAFHEAANLPFTEDRPASRQEPSKENPHG
jgi:cbb3-type cytochrome oxidase subunit 3